ncbi:hypothetical protein [Marinobacterium mangrovicola]|nr:hypothetical protein [Marinobacterium mangrovicola]
MLNEVTGAAQRGYRSKLDISRTDTNYYYLIYNQVEVAECRVEGTE